MATDWNIKSRSHKCTKCERKFEDKEEFTSVLMFSDEGYDREDICKDCLGDNENLHNATVSHWVSVYHVPPPPEEEPLTKETVESLLRKLTDDYEAQNANIIYILAIMLERQRLLIEKAAQYRDDGGLYRIYEHRKTGETFVIYDPELKMDELEELEETQKMVITILDGNKKEVNVAAGVIIADNKILICRRKKGEKHAGYWEFPGGKIEEGEDPKEALHRELEEELCIDAEIGEHMCNSTHDTRKLAVHLSVFEVTKFYGNMVLSVHDSAKWVRPKELLRHKLLPADVPVADFIVQTR